MDTARNILDQAFAGTQIPVLCLIRKIARRRNFLASVNIISGHINDIALSLTLDVPL